MARDPAEQPRGPALHGDGELSDQELDDRLQRLLARVAAAVDAPDPPPSPETRRQRLERLEAAAAALIDREAAKRARIERTDQQFGELVEVVTALASLDYSQRVTVDEGQDDAINALAIGLNMMCEELAHATTALTRTRDDAMAANRAKSAFLANMSHEFRTPLNAIIGYTELINEEHGDTAAPEILADLRRIRGAAVHLLDLIQDTLDISKIEADKLILDVRALSVRALVDDVIATIMPSAQGRGNELILECLQASDMIRGDPTRLRQILLNLLSNANKFTTRGQVTLRVDERELSGARWLDFAIIDTGIGIAPEKQHAIFEAFIQADDSTTRVYGGTGLGLTISRRLCELMGGSLTVESQVGVGSTFTATIPLLVDAAW
jgi:signal transduction histidine kinase